MKKTETMTRGKPQSNTEKSLAEKTKKKKQKAGDM